MALNADAGTTHAPPGWAYEPAPTSLLELLDRDGTGISWTDLTFNPWLGCTERGPGCKLCYARDLARGRMGLTGARDVWGPGRPRQITKGPWQKLGRAERAAGAARTSLRVFCGSMMDVWDAEAPVIGRARLLSVIESTAWIDWILVTKRPELAPLFTPPTWARSAAPADYLWPARNVWHVASAVTAEEVLRHGPAVCALPGLLHGLSLEPLLEDVADALDQVLTVCPSLLWVIVGGESGAIAEVRDFDPAWAARVIEVCRAHGRAPYVKQMGTRWATKNHLVRKADNPNEWPAPLRVQQYPAPRRHAA